MNTKPMMVKAKFDPGQVVTTKRINDRCAKDLKFNQFVLHSFGKHISGDWGDLDEEDKKANDAAVKYGELRISSAYLFNGNKDDKIWIITEWDRSVTTILFPDEY